MKKRVVVFDGAMGTSVQAFHPTAEDFGGQAFEGCNEVFVRSRPDFIEEIHARFFCAGCDAVETDTFSGTPLPLAL